MSKSEINRRIVLSAAIAALVPVAFFLDPMWMLPCVVAQGLHPWIWIPWEALGRERR